MPREPIVSADTAQLRRRAETLLRARRRNGRSKAGIPRLATDTHRLVHELLVHQVELEMQNTELQEARDRLEVLLERYTDLYDFAPVGYLSLDREGQILEANLTGAVLLGVERSRLINRRLPSLAAPASRQILLAFLKRVFAGAGKQVCEVELLKQEGATFWANLHGTVAISTNGPHNWCRVSVSDISAIKQGEEAKHRAITLATTNRELAREIVRRGALEESLLRSQRRQKLLLVESQGMQAQLRHLSHRLLQSQEEERKRISRELHDEITQTLVGIGVQLEALSRDRDLNPGRLRQKIVRTQRLVQKSVKIVHRFARELRPTVLDDLGLIPSLHSLLTAFMKQTGIRVRFTTFRGVEQLSNERRIALYRVAQSALANVARHARASIVKVRIRKLKKLVHMDIVDNGRSFQAERVMRSGSREHLGLLGMRERLEMVGGKLNVESAPGRGTTVSAQLPLRNGNRG